MSAQQYYQQGQGGPQYGGPQYGGPPQQGYPQYPQQVSFRTRIPCIVSRMMILTFAFCSLMELPSKAVVAMVTLPNSKCSINKALLHDRAVPAAAAVACKAASLRSAVAACARRDANAALTAANVPASAARRRTHLCAACWPDAKVRPVTCLARLAQWS